LPKHLSSAVFKTDAVEAYNLAKSKAQPHRDLNMKKTAKAPFELIHVDTEVVNCTSYGGAIYRTTCVCDYSRYMLKRRRPRTNVYLSYDFFLSFSVFITSQFFLFRPIFLKGEISHAPCQTITYYTCAQY
jgi:hypothetical protein